MTASTVGLHYRSDEGVRSLGQRLLARTLPKSEWTHEAHLVAAVYLLKERPELDLAVEMPRIIRSYNDTVGTENSDTNGYHETLTQMYVWAVKQFLHRLPEGVSLASACQRLLKSPLAERCFPLRFYTSERLFSRQARRRWVEPDLTPLTPEAVLNLQEG